MVVVVAAVVAAVVVIWGLEKGWSGVVGGKRVVMVVRL